jgi:flagellar basal body-associated protein FliL
MKDHFEAIERELACCMPNKHTKKALCIALGAFGAVALLGITAAMVYNSKQMKAARALKRTGRVLYMLGTAMRSISGIEGLN